MNRAPQASATRARVLIVDDDASSRRALARAMLERGLTVDTAESGAAALDLLRTRPADAVILDHDMPDLGGLATLERLREKHPSIQVVMLVPHAEPRVSEAALLAGAHAVLPVPIESLEVARALVERAIERARLDARADRLERDVADRDQLGEIVTGAPRMLEVLRRASLAAASAAPLLVMGEPGTGKTLLARTVHRRSRRARGPFVTVSPLTSGAPDLARAFDEAEDGTLAIEDLGALSIDLQTALSAELGRRGERAPRILATALPDLRDKVADGAVRKELFYGIGALLLEIPPLRSRRDDIPLLAYHFLTRYAARESKAIRRIGQEALRDLREHTWPGNVSELRSVIEQTVVMARGEVVVPSDLPLGRARRDDGDDLKRVEIATGDVLELPYPESKASAVDRFERAYVAHCLARAGGNMSEAARLAGLDRSNFRRLTKRLR